MFLITNSVELWPNADSESICNRYCFVNIQWIQWKCSCVTGVCFLSRLYNLLLLYNNQIEYEIGLNGSQFGLKLFEMVWNVRCGIGICYVCWNRGEKKKNERNNNNEIKSWTVNYFAHKLLTADRAIAKMPTQYPLHLKWSRFSSIHILLVSQCVNLFQKKKKQPQIVLYTIQGHFGQFKEISDPKIDLL